MLLIYAIMYVSFSALSLFFLSKKGASRKLKFGVFVGATVAFIGATLRMSGIRPDVDALIQSGPSELQNLFLFLLAIAIWAALFYYAAKPLVGFNWLRGFSLFTFALAIIIFFPALTERDGVSTELRSTLDIVWWVVVIGLLLGSGVVLYRDYVKWKSGQYNVK